MEGGRVYDDSNVTVLLQSERLPCASEVFESLWISNSSTSFHGDSVSGSTSMVNFQNSPGENNRAMPFFIPLEKEENVNEDCDGCFHQREKKRRLTVDQVQFLERSFEVENKLEPERKGQLAKELGLQPRQVAIWFQNRRARYKTKQLEKDYDCLRVSYDKLKVDYDSLFKETEKLKIEVHLLTEKLVHREKDKAKSEPCDGIIPLQAEPQKAIPNTISQNTTNVPTVIYKQEDANSAKSDVFDFDSDSPRCTHENNPSFSEPADSSHVFEPEMSDFSQDEEDNLGRRLLHIPCFPKLEDESYIEPNASSCDLGYTVEDPAVWFLPY